MIIDHNKLKACRVEKGLTQAGLAEQSKISINSISRYERGPSQAEISSANSLATALGIPLNDLCTSPSAMVPEPCSAKEDQSIPYVKKPPLKISNHADDGLKMAAVGLDKDDGSPERVSLAIAGITGYLCGIVCYAPQLKEQTQLLVDAITATLASAVLDPDHASMETLWSVIKNGFADLMELTHLPIHAKREASSVIASLLQARLDNDDCQRLRAVKAALFWLHDYWGTICMEQSAYNTLSNVCCAMASAPTDYATRSRLVACVNNLASLVAIYTSIDD